LSYSIKENYDFIIIVGEEEIKTKEYTIKNLKTREEKKLNIKELVNLLKRI